MCYFQEEYSKQRTVKDGKMIDQININQKKPDKMELQGKKHYQRQRFHHTKIKRISKEDIIILTLFSPGNKTTKYTKQRLTVLPCEIDNSGKFQHFSQQLTNYEEQKLVTIQKV